jgi:leucyl aminopeptidase (aminopeptidase T)
VSKFFVAPTVKRLVEKVLAVRPGERVLLLTDPTRPASITQALAHAISAAGGELALMYMKPTTMGGVEPPEHVAAAMKASECIYLQGSFAATHTDAVREALAAGARVVDMWGFEEEMMTVGGAVADYEEIGKITRNLGERLNEAREGRFSTPDGCNMTFSLEGRECVEFNGIAAEPGQITACPDGEGAIGPVEGSAEGVMVNPVSIEHGELGFVSEPMRFEVSGGYVKSVTGSPTAERFWQILEEGGKVARNIAEFAIGTNPECRKKVTLREAKTAWGTCHMAVGDNRTLGGSIFAPLHVDMIFHHPTVWLDGQVIVLDGKIVGL